jgi:methionyl-tRNA synthetase
MSKSLGNVLDPFEAMDTYGVDALRYYLSRDVQFGADGSVSMEALSARYDGELANELGNLASRSIAMLHRYRNGDVPDGQLDLQDEFAGLCDDVAARLDVADLTGALDAIWQRVRRLNRYVEEQAPWTMAKDEARAGDLDRVLRTLAEGVRVLAVLLWPWIPASADKLLGALGRDDTSYGRAQFGTGVPEAVAELEPLFPKNQR